MGEQNCNHTRFSRLRGPFARLSGSAPLCPSLVSIVCSSEYTVSIQTWVVLITPSGRVTSIRSETTQRLQLLHEYITILLNLESLPQGRVMMSLLLSCNR